MNNADEAAFPVPTVTGLPNGDFIHGVPGLTKREYIAAEIAAGMAAAESESDGYWNDNELAARATRRADALLAELAKPVLP